MNFNKVILGGHLTRDPELKTLASGTTLCGFGLASSRKRAGAEETVFIDCTAFGKTAELVQQYFQKGSPILVEGRLRLEKWQDKISGDNRQKISVTVENIAFVPASFAMGEGGGASVEPVPQPVTESNIFRQYNQIYSETAMPGILARPQMHKTGVADLRNWAGAANEGIDPQPYQAAHRRSSPLVARLEAFGQQGASDWVYTHGTNAGGRYAPSPTADGGWLFAPPESSILQVEANNQPATVSNSYLIFASNTRLGFGRPLMSTGSMKSGISIEADGANNRIKVYTETDGTRAQVFEIDQDIETKTASKGFICRTPDNSKSYRIRVDNSGNVATDLIS